MRYSIILLLLAFLPQSAYSQLSHGEYILSPGIKIGGSSGDEGGLTVGFELSVTQAISNDLFMKQESM